MVGLFTTNLAIEDGPRHIASPMGKLLPGKIKKGNFYLTKPNQIYDTYMIYHIQHLGNIVTSKLCAGAWKRGEEPSFRRHTHRPSLHLLVPFNF